MTERADVLVVGGGIIGLATAQQVAQRYPRLSLAVTEAESNIATHQTGHNSGVVHAGIYYRPGSLKARLCRRGNDLLERFAARHGIPIVRSGKVIVATREDELPKLRELYKRAIANQVPHVSMIDGKQLQAIEPAARGLAAIHSPTTGVVDYPSIAAALATEVTAAGGVILTSWPVSDLMHVSLGEVEAVGPRGRIRARVVIACAGLQADRLARRATKDIRIVPFRGSWYIVEGATASDVRGSIYPVPDPRLPFLGVHLTRRIDGQVWAGPNAFLALSRTAYRRWAINGRDALQALTFTGLWRFALHHIQAAWTEFTHDVSAHAYARALRQYVPNVSSTDLIRGPMGIRAQAMNRRGDLLDDFMIHPDGRVLHLLNAPSPGATSALAIGEMLAGAAGELLGVS